MSVIVAAIMYLFIPALLVFLCQKFQILDKIGVVVLSFGLGILLSASLDFSSWIDPQSLTELQTNLSEIAIALALPMLVFSIDVKHSLKMAGDTMKSMAVALVSVMLISFLGALLFSGQLNNIWQIAGMSVGAYTGGGPNMAAIKTAIDADQAIFVTMTTYDILLSALYLIFVMTIAKPLFGLLLRPFQETHDTQDGGVHESSDHHDKFSHLADETANSYKVLADVKTMPQTLKVLLISACCVGGAKLIAGLFPASMSSAVIIIAITSLGLGASFIPYVRQLANSFQLGMYLILVFCFTMGTMTDTSIITNLNLDLFAYIGFILLGSLVLQAMICKLMNIDTDTFLITSSAAIMSVPFIPVIAGALKNREIIIPGFAAAILGYVIGNYLGIAVAYATRSMLGG
ncbi:DUF819 family protein [Bacterioplanoides sp. SCSIO 12839]|uniref:DUF819 family protein n=1 Tax=Bacterioplanoides sp. SCSIO 12839 TaxID=2829569 RepID=UPI0021067062|nr:DUF819 family protein [Bacterioplanoides sp. SCSIO 12839]UTW49705.1 DUF819 family protein [Bacterioplanoides sp. SCSIO 12839]